MDPLFLLAGLHGEQPVGHDDEQSSSHGSDGEDPLFTTAGLDSTAHGGAAAALGQPQPPQPAAPTALTEASVDVGSRGCTDTDCDGNDMSDDSDFYDDAGTQWWWDDDGKAAAAGQEGALARDAASAEVAADSSREQRAAYLGRAMAAGADGSTTRKGTYVRDSTVKKRRSHADYRASHRERIPDTSLGSPCLSSCAFGQACLLRFSRNQLLQMHEEVYGPLQQPCSAAETKKEQRRVLASWCSYTTTTSS